MKMVISFILGVVIGVSGFSFYSKKDSPAIVPAPITQASDTLIFKRSDLKTLQTVVTELLKHSDLQSVNFEGHETPADASCSATECAIGFDRKMEKK